MTKGFPEVELVVSRKIFLICLAYVMEKAEEDVADVFFTIISRCWNIYCNPSVLENGEMPNETGQKIVS